MIICGNTAYSKRMSTITSPRSTPRASTQCSFAWWIFWPVRFACSLVYRRISAAIVPPTAHQQHLCAIVYLVFSQPQSKLQYCIPANVEYGVLWLVRAGASVLIGARSEQSWAIDLCALSNRNTLNKHASVEKAKSGTP